MAEEAEVPLVELGRVSSGGRFSIDGLVDVSVSDLSGAWRGALGC
jgi:hypothetical protein